MSSISNLVHEQSSSTGTGNLTLSSVNGKRSFNTAFSTGGTDVFWYFISNRGAAEWEVGTGHLSDASTLVRDTVLASSNANAAVSFSAGTKDVTNAVPADKVPFFNSTGGITYAPGSDTDIDIVNIDVTGTPRIFWDESEDGFVANKFWRLVGSVAANYGLIVENASADGYGVVEFNNDVGTHFEFSLGGSNVEGAFFYSPDAITLQVILSDTLIAVFNPGGTTDFYGDLLVDSTSPVLVFDKDSGANNCGFIGRMNTAARWMLVLGDDATESGSDAGSNFACYSFDDAGDFLSIVYGIERATGITTFYNPLLVSTYLGYTVGAGGTVTQITSKATGVTVNAQCGQITTHNASLSAGAEVTFTVTNGAVGAADSVIINHASGGTSGAYGVFISAVAAGSFNVTLTNLTTGSLGQALTLNFALLRGSTS